NLGVEFEKHSVHKDKSDTELAIDYAIDKCANDIVLLGVTGSRLDHTIANISVLYKLAKQNINAVIIDSHNEIYLIKDRLKLSNKDNHFVSIIPLTDSRVTLRGFEYETHSMDFQVGTSLGISNLIKDKEGEIEINSGVCLVIRSKD
ncbi:MAG: thiamine diphosphokinase, partial [Tissierellales bacterium]